MQPFIKRDEMEKRAKDVLVNHRLYSVPVNPVTLAGRLGIKVHNAKFSDESIAGMLTRSDNGSSIFVNHSDPPQRKRFTIAHELGHHFLHLQRREFVDPIQNLFRGLGEDDIEAEHNREEVQANMFAAALLLPEELLRREFEVEKDISRLAQRFMVSEQAMYIRLASLALEA